jgi:hypothetical protein
MQTKMSVMRFVAMAVLLFGGCGGCSSSKAKYQECLADWEKLREKQCNGKAETCNDDLCGHCHQGFDYMEMVTCERLRTGDEHPPEWHWLKRLGRPATHGSTLNAPGAGIPLHG